jgi:hypothetical protein
MLSLEPDFDVEHHVVTLELVLRHFGDKVMPRISLTQPECSMDYKPTISPQTISRKEVRNPCLAGRESCVSMIWGW